MAMTITGEFVFRNNNKTQENDMSEVEEYDNPLLGEKTDIGLGDMPITWDGGLEFKDDQTIPTYKIGDRVRVYDHSRGHLDGTVIEKSTFLYNPNKYLVKLGGNHEGQNYYYNALKTEDSKFYIEGLLENQSTKPVFWKVSTNTIKDIQTEIQTAVDKASTCKSKKKEFPKHLTDEDKIQFGQNGWVRKDASGGVIVCLGIKAKARIAAEHIDTLIGALRLAKQQWGVE